jgi:hypothetical protein
VIGDTTHHDGGIGYNNPAHLVLVDLEKKHSRPPRLIMSVGTGEKGTRKTLPKSEQVDEARRSGTRRQRVKKHLELFNALKDVLTNKEDAVTNVGSRAEAERFSSFRFDVPKTIQSSHDGGQSNPHCLGEVPLDEWIPWNTGEVTLGKIQDMTERYLQLEETMIALDESAKMLVLVRRQRARTERWERYATDLTYRCCEDRCGLDRNLKRRPEMRTHLEDMHGKTGDELEETLNRCRRPIDEMVKKRRTTSYYVNGQLK